MGPLVQRPWFSLSLIAFAGEEGNRIAYRSVRTTSAIRRITPLFASPADMIKQPLQHPSTTYTSTCPTKRRSDPVLRHVPKPTPTSMREQSMVTLFATHRGTRFGGSGCNADRRVLIGRRLDDLTSGIAIDADVDFEFPGEQVVNDLVARVAKRPPGKERAFTMLMELTRKRGAPTGVVAGPDVTQRASLNVRGDQHPGRIKNGRQNVNRGDGGLADEARLRHALPTGEERFAQSSFVTGRPLPPWR